MHRKLSIVKYSLVAQCVFSFGAYFIFSAKLKDNHPLCFVFALLGIGAAAALLFGYSLRDSRPSDTFWWDSTKGTVWTLVGHAFALIFLFAGIYRGFGILPSGTATAIHDWDVSLYFSVVTWTTLGYGDFVPPREIQLIAAMQALLGYIFFGLIIGLSTHHLTNKD